MVASPTQERLLLTVPEVARLTGLGVSHVWRLVAAGRLPVVKVGRSTRIRRDDLERFIDGLTGE